MLLSTSRQQRLAHHSAIRGIHCHCSELGVSCSTTRTARKIEFRGSRAVPLPWRGGAIRGSSSCTAQLPSSIYLSHKLANRICILPNLCSLQQQRDSPMMYSQSSRIDRMHKVMAASTNPSFAAQTPPPFTRAPPSFFSNSMDGAGNKMMSR